jgi:sugar lactone lactonase YvrE
VSDMHIQVAVASQADVGEGPVWDAATGSLHWVDIAAGLIHRTDVATGETLSVELQTTVGAVALHPAGGYVAATTRGFLRVDADGGASPIAEFLSERHRMNDAKCDPAGRLWAGSVELSATAGEGALHVLDEYGRHRTVLDGLTLPNGMDWSPDGRTFFFVDTIPGRIDAYEFDASDGTLGRQRTIVEYGDGAGTGQPDGMCVDADGCLWVAMWGGAAVEHRSPEGELLLRVDVPVRQPSSCAFGGPGLDTLYVTSARRGLDSPADVDGAVLAITGLSTRGRRPTPYAKKP